MADLPKTPKSIQGLDPERAGTFLPREGTRRSYKAQGLARLMPKVTRQIAGKRPTLISDLQFSWNQVVGDDLAQSTRPVSLKARVLHLEIAAGAGPALTMQQDSMIRRINMHLGAGKVKRLSLHQVDFPLPEKSTPPDSQNFVTGGRAPLTDDGSQPNNKTKVGSALENLKAKLERRADTKKEHQPPPRQQRKI